MNKETTPTKMLTEKAILVGVDIYNEKSWLSFEDSLDELALLASTAGLVIVGELTQSLSRPYGDTYIGSGKVDELKALVQETDSNVVVFDNELSPRHQRELEKLLGEDVHIIDRTALILDIFAQHASTREGILQVELAQYEYRLPRLTRAWTHLARQAGGGGGRTGSVGGVGLRGPGETQLEVDRREIHKKIAILKIEIEKIRAHRSRYRAQRKRSRIPTVALVGYTNAGKSTLLNLLSDAGVMVADKLFATLDPTTRRVKLPEGHICLFTDTVGFIQKLPTQLVAAFRATLEEIAEAELLLHIVDISHPSALAQWQSVNDTLAELDAQHIPTITVLNKIDKLSNPEITKFIPGSVSISALQNIGIENLLAAIEKELFFSFIPVLVRLPYQEGKLISLMYEQGKVESSDHQKSGVVVNGSVPVRLLPLYEPYFIQPGEIEELSGEEETDENER
ncbi:MAG: GTPase HflX [Chloroflexi bacterium 44-23]|nr:MAG: GTPase HflX [Chloroflexi bacterium 44-23]